MTDFTTFLSKDERLPKSLLHSCDIIMNGDQLEQYYNFLQYEFDNGGLRVYAKSYVDDIGTVTIFVHTEKGGSKIGDEEWLKSDDGRQIVAYLRRRYRQIEIATLDGFRPLRWPE